MPRRMLRHRVIQQCARLALGIAASEGHSKLENKIQNPDKGIELLMSQSNKLKTIMSRNVSG